MQEKLRMLASQLQLVLIGTGNQTQCCIYEVCLPDFNLPNLKPYGVDDIMVSDIGLTSNDLKKYLPD